MFDIWKRSLDVFAYYDRPVLFTTIFPNGKTVLVVLSDENSVAETWIAVYVSAKTIIKLRMGAVDFYTVFRNERWLWKIVRPWEGGEVTCNPILASQVPDDDLPDKGERLKYP